MPTGLGGEQLWISATNDNTGTSTAFNDQSGNGNNGTAIGTTVVADTSEGGTYAFDFDGAGDYIDIQGLSGQYPLGGSYSTSLWVNNDVTNIDQLYFSRYETDGASGSNDQRPEILMSDDTGLRTRALYKVGTGTVGLNANSTYQGGVWYHIASTYDSATNTMTLYKNGVSVGSVVTASDSDWETNYAEIGRASISGGATQVYSDCKLDDIRSFTRVLTQAEITRLATSRGIEGPPPTGLGGEQLWISATNDNTGTSTAFNDQSGTGNNGTPYGTLVVADTASGGTYAFDFDGIDDFVSTPFADTSTTSTGVFSMACWVKYDSVAANSSMMSGNLQTDKTGLCLYFDTFNSSRGQGGLMNPDNPGQYTGQIYAGDRDTVSTGQWYHVAYTGDGSTARLYIDGVEVGSAAITQFSAFAWSNALQIGRYLTGVATGGGYLNGRIDDARVYTRAITPAEVTYLARSRGIESPVGLGDEKLWLCPTLNGSANDISGNGNDGTYQGGMGTVADSSNGGTYAFDFDGVDDYIDTGSTTVHQNTVFSYAFWINASASGSGTDGTVGSYDAGAGARGPLASSISGDSKLTFLYQSLGTAYNSAQQLKSTGNVYDSTWRHVACVFDGNQNEVKIYIDGSLDSSKTASVPNIVNITTALKIGAGSGGYTAGLMDDIRVYNRTLTQADVSHLSTSRGIEGSPYTGLGDEQLWLCPSLSDSANDISGNGNDGTYQGGMGTVADTNNGGSYAYDMSATSTSRISLPASFGPAVYSDSSVSGWFKYSGPIFNADPDMALIGTGSTVGQWYQAGRVNNFGNQTGTYRTFADDGADNGDCSVVGTGNEEDNTWHHVVFVRDYTASTGTFYVDGVSIGSAAFTSSAITAVNDLFIGYSAISGYGYSGNMIDSGESLYFDDIRAYSRVLTQAEITHLATSRGIEGGPGGPPASVFFNPFKSHTFHTLTGKRIR